MTAGRDRSAGQASLSVAARDGVSFRADGRTDGRVASGDPIVTALRLALEEVAERRARATLRVVDGGRGGQA